MRSREKVGTRTRAAMGRLVARASVRRRERGEAGQGDEKRANSAQPHVRQGVALTACVICSLYMSRMKSMSDLSSTGKGGTAIPESSEQMAAKWRKWCSTGTAARAFE